MPQQANTPLVSLLAQHEQALLDEWLRLQLAATNRRSDLIGERDLREQSRRFLSEFQRVLSSGAGDDVGTPPWAPVRDVLEELARERARQGFTSSETATFVFSLKQPLFERLRKDAGRDPAALADVVWTVTVLLEVL